MVALSLYKGNLHKVPDVPRRWPRPTPKISLKDFKILLRRRSRALTRLHSSASNIATASNPNHSPNCNPNYSSPDPSSADKALKNNDDVNYNDNDDDNSRPEPELPSQEDLKEGEEEKEEEVMEEKGDVKGDTGIEDEEALEKLVEKTDASVEDNSKNEDKTEVLINPEIERSNAGDATSDKEKRKKEVKEKLEILNEKKHSLVQVLKQILSAEEQLKRQNSMQGTSGRPPLPLQVDTTTDTGSMTRVNTPRMGSDGNPCGDMDGGEADDVSNHNIHSRHLLRMSSTSPSSDSQQRKPASNMAPLTYRTTLGVAGSPSRFAPGGQGHSSVSVSGTSYIASSPSPSPAASGGTSVFRDGRLPSPWN